ncbi:MAG: hypothetical protein ACK5AL_07505 [Planctomycetota bacterium]
MRDDDDDHNDEAVVATSEQPSKRSDACMPTRMSAASKRSALAWHAPCSACVEATARLRMTMRCDALDAALQESQRCIEHAIDARIDRSATRDARIDASMHRCMHARKIASMHA